MTLNSRELSIDLPVRTGSLPERLQWGALCLFILAQAYTIPVAAVGPTWALWPTLPDLTFLVLLLTTLISGPLRLGEKVRPEARTFGRALLVAGAGTLLSYGILVAAGANGLSGGIGALLGGYQFARFLQSALAFWIASRIRLSEAQRIMLGNLCGVALLVCVTLVLGTAFNIVPTEQLVGDLPYSIVEAGPWYTYLIHNEGLGVVGYNHGQVALQVIVLFSLRQHLLGAPETLREASLLVLGILACFFSGSRTGLASILIFTCLWLLYRPRLRAWAITAFVAAVIALGGAEGLGAGVIEDSLERQQTLVQEYDSENLSGRDDIWSERLTFLNEAPTRWLVGSGFGSSFQSGNNAHNQLLQVTLETGVLGLLVYGWLLVLLLRGLLRGDEAAGKPFLWATVGLLASCASQETFWPVPAFQSWLALFGLALGLVLRPPLPAPSDHIE